MKLKVPQFLTTRPTFFKPKSGKPKPKLLKATTAARRMAPAMDDDYDEEPTTRLSSAFFVVLILHVVAVGGIYAFNSIKAHRRGLEPSAKSVPAASAGAASAVTVAQKTNQADVETVPKTIPALEAQVSALAPLPTAGAHAYQVKPGDTLTRIAQQTNVTIAELQLANNLKDSATLRPGQTLQIPAAKAANKPALAPSAPKIDANARKPDATAAATGSKTYAVQKGDTAISIAKKFGVTVEELLKVNKVSDPKKLQLGQSLKMPAKKAN